MKSNVVRKNDYELYLMNVPLTLFGKKKRQFIKRELEKVHPCFGEQFSFDSKRCVRKGKVQTLIAVMDKVKILEYKRNKASGLHLEGIKTGAMFDGHGKVLAVSVLILLVLAIGLGMFGSISRKKGNPAKPVVAQEDYNYISEAQAVEPLDSSCGEILGNCLEKIRDNGGEIKSISVETDDAGENDFLLMKLSLRKMFPEKMMPEKVGDDSFVLSFSTVSYDGEEPSFDCSVKSKIQKEASSVPDEKQVAEIRSVLGDCCVIREEDFVNAVFRCELVEKNFVEMFEKIGSMESIALKEFSLVKNSRGYDVSLSFRNGQRVDELTQALLEYSSLFVQEKGKVETKGKNSHPKMRVVSGIKAGSQWQKIGRVVQKNGGTITYYRDEKNQIIGVEE